MAKNKVGVHGSDEETGRSNGGKTKCPITLGEFQDVAKELVINIAGQTVVANVKEFSTGSFGWHANGKVTVALQNGPSLPVQVSINLTVIGSKPGKE